MNIFRNVGVYRSTYRYFTAAKLWVAPFCWKGLSTSDLVTDLFTTFSAVSQPNARTCFIIMSHSSVSNDEYDECIYAPPPAFHFEEDGWVTVEFFDTRGRVCRTHEYAHIGQADRRSTPRAPSPLRVHHREGQGTGGRVNKEVKARQQPSFASLLGTGKISKSKGGRQMEIDRFLDSDPSYRQKYQKMCDELKEVEIKRAELSDNHWSKNYLRKYAPIRFDVNNITDVIAYINGDFDN